MSDAPMTPAAPDPLAGYWPAPRPGYSPAGPGYRTDTWLRLREDHAAARDAVHAELDLPSLGQLLAGFGLAAADSLSAYLAYRPRSGHTDADRKLVSNIRARSIGVSVRSQPRGPRPPACGPAHFARWKKVRRPS